MTRGTYSRTGICVLLSLAAAAGQGEAKKGGLSAVLASAKPMVFAGRPLTLTLTIANSGPDVTPSLPRSIVVRDSCVIAAPPMMAPGERKGEWTKLVQGVKTGTFARLELGDSIQVTIQVTLPDDLSIVGGPVSLQWVGAKNSPLDGLRSNELPVQVMPTSNPLVTIETSEGTIVLELWPDKAPNHVMNFIELSEKGRYANLLFHRVIAGFMIQTGCPEGTGNGGPGYRIGPEFNDSSFKKGVLGMARAGEPDSAGSQFFICVNDQPSLDKQYTAFGKVLEGQDVADRISGSRTTPGVDRPLQDVHLKSVTVDLPKGFERKAVTKAVEGGKMSPVTGLIQTSLGNLTIELWPDKAPNHVENFVKLAEKGFYNHLLFHRVIDGFMIQTGCPLGSGTGGPGWKVKAEFNDARFTKGVLGMARSAHPDSAGSQFFICVADAAHLNGSYTAFGKITAGMEIADRIAKLPRDRRDKPLEDVKMLTVAIDALQK